MSDPQDAVETEQEVDGRWIAQIPDLPGLLAYGLSEGEAIARVRALADAVRHGYLTNSEESQKIGAELDDMLDQVTPANRHDEVDWGALRGKEVW